MADLIKIRNALYTRQQVANLTGLDDSTLNYWMREGVLRSAEGGGGKGQHRRFPYHQINLALLLDQLRGFGVSLPAIKRLADRFHDAVDFMATWGVTRDNMERVDMLLRVRKQIEEHGFYEHTVMLDQFDRFKELFPWIDGRELTRPHAHAPYWQFEQSFDETLDVFRKGALLHGRQPGDDEGFSDEIVRLARTIDLPGYVAADLYWTPITSIGTSAPSEYYSSTPEILYRDATGEWQIAASPPAGVSSYVNIELEQLTYRAWVGA